MKLGVVFPQNEIGTDPGAIRDYAQAAEALGYNHLLAYDHVIIGDPVHRPAGWRTNYTIVHQFHEPLVLFGYLAGVTERLSFVTGILILPQRQTVLVAKQAAEIDVLSGGRLRLGVAVGWNPIEYESLNESFETRGRRIAEQIDVMRKLWTQPLVNYTGRWHRIDRAAINPLPVQQPIPVWMGGMTEVVLKRIARIADGWFPQFRPGDAASIQLTEHLRDLIRDAGRDPSSFGIEGRVPFATVPQAEWAQQALDWQALGASHLGVNTMGAGLTTPDDHIDAIRRFKETVSATLGEPALR